MIVSPLTQSPDVTLLKTIPSERLIRQWKAQYGIDITGELHGNEWIRLYRCNKSRLRFFAPLDIAGSGRLYEQLGTNRKDYFSMRWEFEAAAEDLKECVNVLEIGCGEGDFLGFLAQKIPRIKGEGIDINPKAVAVAVSKGVRASQASMEALAKTRPASFDAVVASHVLEHTPRPKEFLEMMIRLVKPGGKLILAVPNQDSYLKYDDENLLNQPPHHMTQWSVPAFRFLESIFPLKIKRFRVDPITEAQIDIYAAIQSRRFPLKILRSIFYVIFYDPFLKPFFKKHPRVRALIPGENLYVCFERTQQMPDMEWKG